jgi:hypothetical protein
MKKKRLIGLVGIAALAGSGLALSAGPAFATDDRGGQHDLRCFVEEQVGYTWDVQTWQEVTPAGPSTFAPQFDGNDSRATGHFEATPEGLHIWTEGATSTDKVALYRNVSIPLADISSVSLDYTATLGITPGSQLVVDIDGDNVGDGILVGEAVYGENFWLNNAASDAFKALDPSGAEDGGNGSAYFGTLAQWSTAAPTAKVVAIGFSLGSGVHADGLLTGITINEVNYPFTKIVEGSAAVYGWVTTGHGEGAEAPLGQPGKTQYINVEPKIERIKSECDRPAVVASSLVAGDCKTQVDVKTTTTTPWVKEKVRDGYKWVYILKAGKTVETTENIAWTDKQKEACVTSTPTPTPTPTTTPVPVKASSNAALAETGGTDATLGWVAGGLVTALGATLATLGYLRRRAQV